MIRRVAATLAGMWLMLAAGACVAVDFSADIVGKTARGQSFSGKYYTKGAMTREEMAVGSKRQIMIVRPDKKIVWVLFPAKKQYAETKSSPRSEFDLSAFLKRPGTKQVGTQVVNGFTCRKIVQSAVGSDDKKVEMTVWYSDKLKHPMKMVHTARGSTRSLEMKNVKLTSPPASLFELPKGYKKVAIKRPPKPGRMAKPKKK